MGPFQNKELVPTNTPSGQIFENVSFPTESECMSTEREVINSFLGVQDPSVPFELGLKSEQGSYRSFWVGEECCECEQDSHNEDVLQVVGLLLCGMKNAGMRLELDIQTWLWFRLCLQLTGFFLVKIHTHSVKVFMYGRVEEKAKVQLVLS